MSDQSTGDAAAEKTGSAAKQLIFSEDYSLAQQSEDKLVRINMLLRTWMRLIANLEACKIRLAPSWANACWAFLGLFVPFLISSLNDISVQQRSNQPFSLTPSILAALVSLVALLISFLSYLSVARVENGSIDTILDEMKEILDTWTK
jgi:hypothetical protein